MRCKLPGHHATTTHLNVLAVTESTGSGQHKAFNGQIDILPVGKGEQWVHAP